MYSESNIMGWNLGWMGNKEEDVFSYMSKSQKENWRNGCGKALLDSDNITHLQHIDYNNRKIVVDGKLYK